ncbi:phage integrase central domain-containing protein [Gluconobacter cerinus]|uniref:phage integrase central domain-containing protein n=1 Tax=Gluconobacter cerinus TaxID=38307 RepID=UPI0038D21B08
MAHEVSLRRSRKAALFWRISGSQSRSGSRCSGRSQKRADRQLQSVGEKWISGQGTQWTERHRDDVATSLQRFVWPTPGRINLDDITPPMVLEIIRRIEAIRAKETARRVRQRLMPSLFLGWPMGWEVTIPPLLSKGRSLL